MSRFKVFLTNYLLKNCLRTVTEDSFLTIQYVDSAKKRGYILKGGVALPPEQQREMKIDAQALLKIPTFNKIIESMRWNATDMMVNKSKTVEDMVFGKAIVYNLDVLVSKLEKLAALELPDK